jgi:hypothetical protein
MAILMQGDNHKYVVQQANTIWHNKFGRNKCNNCYEYGNDVHSYLPRQLFFFLIYFITQSSNLTHPKVKGLT